MYNIKLTRTNIDNILKALGGAEANEILDYETVGKLWDYLTGEVEKQANGTGLKGMEFSEFKNCALNTAEIMERVGQFWGSQSDLLRYIYSLLFYTDIKIEDKQDLEKIISGYYGYTEGKFVTMIIE